MPERDQGDHWDFLAADLGASPVPEKEAKEEAPESPSAEAEAAIVEEPRVELPDSETLETGDESPAEVPQGKPTGRQRGQKGDRVVSGFGYRRGSVDWANLARELGVEAMEEAPTPIPAGEAASESEPSVVASAELVAEEPIEAEVVEEVFEEVVEGEVEPPVADEPALGGFGVGILDELIPDPVNASEERAEVDEPQEERKGRRRRRRRKPKKQEGEQPQIAEDSTGEAAELETATPSKEESDEEESPRRRGRRRGGRKRAPREEVATEPDGFGVGVGEDSASANEFDIFEVDESETDEEDTDSTGRPKSRGDRSKDRGQDRKSGKKVTHRGIPSWDEAVGHIIDTNMEGRSKKPEASGSRQRQGRRRGGDRSGSRGRS